MPDPAQRTLSRDTSPDAEEVQIQVLDALDRLGIRHHLGGSYASSVHGLPRQTRDADLVVDLHSQAVPPLAFW